MTHKIRLVPGEVKKSRDFTVHYATEEGEPILLSDCDQTPSLTTLRSPSGTGKSTLLEHFVRSMRDREKQSPGVLGFLALPAAKTMAVGVVPQNPPVLNHWFVRRFLPQDSQFAVKVFDGTWTDLRVRRLGELSGGQQRRVYACSVIEWLAQQDSEVAVLLLDETLDGLNPYGAGAFLDQVSTQWTKQTKRLLSVILVTHLPELRCSVLEAGISASLELMTEAANALHVKVKAAST